MSDKFRSTVTQEMLDAEYVTAEEKARCLATSLYNLSVSNPFMGATLQILEIQYSHTLPTAGVMFDATAKKWQMFINPFFFCKKLNHAKSGGDKARQGVLLHELYHIVHKHPMRVPFIKLAPNKRMIMNIAADMAINSYIPNLPEGCAQCPPKDAATYKPCENTECPGSCVYPWSYSAVDDTGKMVPLPAGKPMEWYYEKLLTLLDDENPPPQGEFDQHNWDGADASGEKEMLDATEELVKRAMIKQQLGFDQLPGSIKELLKDIETRKSELNYRGLILSAIKKNASGHDRKHTWTRKSKRFGFQAPGTKEGDLPKLHLYLDTSGSISVEELNEFLGIVDEFLRVGARKCNLSFFHTEVYRNEEYKRGRKINREDVQSGGTDLTPVMASIVKNRSDLAIVITDGCYSDVDTASMLVGGKMMPQCLFIISRGGAIDHPLKRYQTIKVPENAVIAKRG